MERTPAYKKNTASATVRPLRIGLLGFGTVGKAFYTRSTQHPTSGIRICKVCVQHHAKHVGELPADILTTDLQAFFRTDVDVFVELIDDVEVAYQAFLEAQRLHIPFITANKRMVANNLKAICNAIIPVLYEGSVGGGIPILQTLHNYYTHSKVQALVGILNGSSHHVLCSMQAQRCTLAHALQDAQEKGLAEADPSLDIDGYDAQYKLHILLWHAFGRHFPLKDIHRISCAQISPRLLQYATQQDATIKPLASVERCKDGIFACVAPFIVPHTVPFSHLTGPYNQILLQTELGTHSITGLGAGGPTTALAVWSDVLAIQAGSSGYTQVTSTAPYLPRTPDRLFVHIDPLEDKNRRILQACDGLQDTSVGIFTGYLTIEKLQQLLADNSMSAALWLDKELYQVG